MSEGEVINVHGVKAEKISAYDCDDIDNVRLLTECFSLLDCRTDDINKEPRQRALNAIAGMIERIENPLICVMPPKDVWDEVLEVFGLKLKK